MTTLRQARILVVDDVDYNRDVMARLLGRDGHHVVTASGGLEALDLLRGEPFDLVLLDVMMPDMDGIEVMDAIHADGRLRHLPVVMLSAQNEQEGIIKCLKLGAQDYLTKPLNHAILHARIDSCLEKKRLRDLEKDYLERVEAMDAQLQEANEHLTQANQVKSRFLATAAHDLKNPLTSIQLLAGMIAEETRQAFPESAARADRICEVGRKMLQIVGGILDTAANEIRDITLRLEESNIPSLVHQVVQANQDYAQGKGIRLAYEEMLAGECWGRVDESALRQAVDNLVNNAIKYSPRDTHVEVRLRPQITDGRSMVLIEVRDQGPGLSAEDQARAFGLFQRLSAQPTGDEYSTGLGLSIVKQMVELHGGRVWIESELGKGAAFCIELPLGPHAVPTLAELEDGIVRD